MLKIVNVKKKYEQEIVLKGINLEVQAGEIVVVVGPSGGGKTTLLRIINGLCNCDDGKIVIDNDILCCDGEYISRKNTIEVLKKVGMVFQSFNLFPHMNVLENIIEAPLAVLKKDREEVIKNAKELLKILDMKDKEKSYPCQLSGGQKQRVAIARALALKPKVLCFDEPTSALDPELTEEVAKVIKKLKIDGVAILIITHDMDFAKKVADKIVSMDKGHIINEDIFCKK